MKSMKNTVDAGEVRAVLERTESYLRDTLLPFWMEKSPDREVGGFLSYFDRNGRPTGETDKPFLQQVRMLFAMSDPQNVVQALATSVAERAPGGLGNSRISSSRKASASS